jgi:hypothetical protein
MIKLLLKQIRKLHSPILLFGVKKGVSEQMVGEEGKEENRPPNSNRSCVSHCRLCKMFLFAKYFFHKFI